MEPFRILIDRWTFKYMKDVENLTREHKNLIVNIFNGSLMYQDKKIVLSTVIEKFCDNALQYLNGEQSNVIFPSFDTFEEYEL